MKLKRMPKNTWINYSNKKLSANARVFLKTLDIAIIFFYKSLSFYKKIENFIIN